MIPGNERELKGPCSKRGVPGFKCFLVALRHRQLPTSTEERDQKNTARRNAKSSRRTAPTLLVHAEKNAKPIEEGERAAKSMGNSARVRRRSSRRDRAPPRTTGRSRGISSPLRRDLLHDGHIVHLSSSNAVPLASSRASARGRRSRTPRKPARITSRSLPRGNRGRATPQFKCCPPIREADNREALWQALRDGHNRPGRVGPLAVHARARRPLEAGDFMTAWGGIPGPCSSVCRPYRPRHSVVASRGSPTSRAGRARRKRRRSRGYSDRKGWNRGRPRRRPRDFRCRCDRFVVDPAAAAPPQPRHALRRPRRSPASCGSTWLRGTPVNDRRAARQADPPRRSMTADPRTTPEGGHPPQTQLLTDRAVFTEAYAVIPRGTMRDIVTSALPFWEGTRLWVLSRPLSGFAETFSQYIMEVQPGGGSDRPDTDTGAEGVPVRDRGPGRLADGRGRAPRAGSPGALPTCRRARTGPCGPRATSRRGSTGFRRLYEAVSPGSTCPRCWCRATMTSRPRPCRARRRRWATTRFVDPADLRHDMHVTIVTFQPGGVIPFAETHVMEHGLYVLEGKAVYRLNEDWVEVQEGDFMWLRAFCPQACYAGRPRQVPVPAVQGRQPAHAAAVIPATGSPGTPGRPRAPDHGAASAMAVGGTRPASPGWSTTMTKRTGSSPTQA